jgi:hypothetical protein
MPSGRLKKNFDQVDEAMFQIVEKPFKHIFGIQGIEKSDLDEVALVTFK